MDKLTLDQKISLDNLLRKEIQKWENNQNNLPLPEYEEEIKSQVEYFKDIRRKLQGP